MPVITRQVIVFSRRFKEFLQGASSEEVELKQLGQLLKGDTESAEKLEIAEQKISDQGHIDLSQDGIGRVADKGFDLQVLFDKAISVRLSEIHG